MQLGDRSARTKSSGPVQRGAAHPEQARLTALAANAARRRGGLLHVEYHLMSGDLPLAINNCSSRWPVDCRRSRRCSAYAPGASKCNKPCPKRGSRSGVHRITTAANRELIQYGAFHRSGCKPFQSLKSFFTRMSTTKIGALALARLVQSSLSSWSAPAVPARSRTHRRDPLEGESRHLQSSTTRSTRLQAGESEKLSESDAALDPQRHRQFLREDSPAPPPSSTSSCRGKGRGWGCATRQSGFWSVRRSA